LDPQKLDILSLGRYFLSIAWWA